MKKVKLLLGAALIAIGFSSCSMNSQTMREPAAHVQWAREDFELSRQVSAEATTTRILGIDFSRLFKKERGSVSGGNSGAPAIPVIGSLQNYVSDKTVNYALWNLYSENAGYDVIFYPQYLTQTSGFIPFFWTTTVKVTARMGRIK